ncbi:MULTISPECIES: OadG family protein [unclassified Campylobacter]|uniref:OadG family protein n=1 Tax=unclassified Campylobacter TaxID=2593542 RepID=UPI003D34FBBB
MQDVNLVAEGFRFMVLGMGGVFSFLLLMIFVLKIQSKVFAKFDNSHNITPNKSQIPVSNIKDDGILTAVISAAITQHKKRSKGR